MLTFAGAGGVSFPWFHVTQHRVVHPVVCGAGLREGRGFDPVQITNVAVHYSRDLLQLLDCRGLSRDSMTRCHRD